MELNKRKLYDPEAPNKSTRIINGESSNVLNWNSIRHNWAYAFYKNQLNNFWRAEEINMNGDIKQWNTLTGDEQDTFLKIIGLLAFLDSVQTDFASKVTDYITDSSIAANLGVLAFFEIIHNQSYSYILASLVPEAKQNEVFEFWKTDEILRERNDFIAKGYEKFVENPTPQSFFEAIVFDVILEGLFFYAGFAFFYNLARNQKMLSSSQMISYINRDEQLHVGIFTNVFKALIDDYPELNTPENMQFVTDTFKRAAELEIKWGEYIIGSKFDGIDMRDLSEYVRFMANKRCVELGVERPFSRDNRNPLPWIRHFEDANAAKQDFFEGKSRQYSKVSDTNGFDDL